MNGTSAPTGNVRPRFFYGWTMVAAGSASNFLVFGMIVFAFSTLIDPMREELGWTVAAISLGFSIRSFEQGGMSPVTGFLVDRFGPRRMAVTGILIASLGLVMFSQAYHLWTYYLASIVISFGQV